MRIAEFVLSAIVAFAVAFVIFDSNKEELPLELSNSANDYSISFSTIPTAAPDSILNLQVAITGSPDSTLRYWFRHVGMKQIDTSRLYQFDKTPLTAVNIDSGLYRATLATGKRSNILKYYFEVRDPVGRLIVDLKAKDGDALRTHVIGKVDSWIFYGYFLTMFLAIFAISKAAIGSIAIAGDKGNISDTKRFFVIGLVINLISALILKNWYGFQLNADTWQAVPFGSDLPDNLQQILMVYLVMMIVLSGRAIKVVPKSLIGFLGIFSFFLMAAAYLLPLVMSSEAFPVTTVSYAVIAAVALAIIVTMRAAKRA